MKMLKYSFFFLSLILFSSCGDFFSQTTKVDLPEQPPKIGVTATWVGAPDDSMFVLVSKSVGPLDDQESTVLSGAEVVLFEDGELLDTFVEEVGNAGWYIPSSKITLKAGKTYRLEVDAPNLTKVYATQVMPPKVELTNAEFYLSDSKLRVTFKDEKDVRNYYYLSSYQFYDSDTLSTLYMDETGLAEISNLGHYNLLIKDNGIDGLEFSQLFKVYSSYVAWHDWTTSDSVEVRLTNLSEDFYRFDKTYGEVQEGTGPFSEPVILHRNVENGYGIFALGNTSRLKIPTQP